MTNMYPWVDETRNFIGGRCPHRCSYCYVQHLQWSLAKKRYKGKLRLLENEFKKPLGSGRTLFIGSCIDMWAEKVPDRWIAKVLEYCRKYPDNTYLFQSKNPVRFWDFAFRMPRKIILGTTIETNRESDKPTEAPSIGQRLIAMYDMGCDTMISIEPIMNFDLDEFVEIIKSVKPKFVSIGADSQGHNLPEPSHEKVISLVQELEKFTEVKIKSNLKRLIE